MSNMDLWDKLSRTDPAHTKTFKRAGGFSGTAVKPIYTVQRMTEEFGPCGQGWGIGEPVFQVVPGDNKEVLVFCTVGLWTATNGVQNLYIYGVGGDKVVTHIKANEQYNRPERWENDDEAFKKAFTDAVGNAMKYLGMSADVHMGLFDDSKYVTARKQEIVDNAKGPEDRTPEQILEQFLDRVRDMDTREDFELAWAEEKSALSKIQRNAPEMHAKFMRDLAVIRQGRGLDGEKPDPIATRAKAAADDLVKAIGAAASLADASRVLIEKGLGLIEDDGTWTLKDKTALAGLKAMAPDQYARIRAAYSQKQETI